MKLSEKQREFSRMVGLLIEFAYEMGFEFTFGEAFRTGEQQEIHLRNGASRVKRSKHQDRLALDLNLFVDGRYTSDKDFYRPIGEKWEELGGRWGGRFGVKKEDYDTKVGWDAGHFEFRG